jgi:hypothetical protein
MLNRFPKTRPALPDEFAAIYETQYKENRGGKTPAYGAAQRMESWLHRKVAADVCRDRSARATLEIGAGTLNQLPFEPQVGPYDIVEPFAALFEGSPFLPRVRNIYSDTREIPTRRQYDRITSIAVFEHVCDLPEVVSRAGLLLNDGGELRVSIPSEGTWLWTLGWKLTTGLEFRLRYGLDYGVLMKHEHVNTAAEIEDVLRHFFRSLSCDVFGLSRGISFYRFYACSNPDRARCEAYLNELNAG